MSQIVHVLEPHGANTAARYGLSPFTTYTIEINPVNYVESCRL